MMRLPLPKMKLLLLLSLLNLHWPGMHSTLYTFRISHHASRALKAASGVSVVQCGMWCQRSPDCVQWSREPGPDGVCRLWSPPSDTNPATEDRYRLYQAVPESSATPTTTPALATTGSSLPDGFSISGDPNVAYMVKAERFYSTKEAVVNMCKTLDNTSFPAFPVNEQQTASLKTFGNSYYLLGAWRNAGESEFTDMTSGKRSAIPSARFWDDAARSHTGESCISVAYSTFYIHPCGRWMEGTLCQVDLA